MKILACLFFIFLIFPVVSADIFIEDNFDNLYNVGDLIDLNFSIVNDYSVSGFIEVTLECDDNNFLLKKEYASLEASKKKYFYVESPLAIEGDCDIEISYLGESEISEEFKISDRIEIQYFLNDKSFFPNETLKINGSAKKENGDKYEGVLKIKFDGLEEKSIEIVGGKFDFEYTVKEDLAPGNYPISFEVVERDYLGDILNSGKIIDTIRINSKPSKLKILGVEEFSPPLDYNFSIFVFDQVENLMKNKSIVVKLKNPLGDLVFQKEIFSDETYFYNFSEDAMKGGWILNAYFDGLVGVKPIYVTENKKLKTSISQNSIIFENIGNVDYDGIVSFSLNNGSFNETFYLNVSIDVGEEYVHNLGYSGDYNLTLDGKDFGPVHLTGYSILGNKPLEKEDYFFFAGILLFLVAVLFFTFRKKRCKEKNKKQKEIKKISQIPNKNLNKKNFQKNIPIKSYYILFLESEISNSKYRMIIEKYGFKLNSLSENLGYVLISNPSFSNPELKLYNLAKGIQKFSEIKSSKVSIVLNKGRFESKMSLLKKFALLTRKLLNYSDGKIAMTKKYFLSLGISSPKEIKKVNFMQRDLHLYYF